MGLEWNEDGRGLDTGNNCRAIVESINGGFLWRTLKDGKAVDAGLVLAGPDALVQAKAAAEKAMVPVAVDPLEEEAKRLDVRWKKKGSTEATIHIAGRGYANLILDFQSDGCCRALLAAVRVLLAKPEAKGVNASPADALRPNDRHGMIPASPSPPDDAAAFAKWLCGMAWEKQYEVQDMASEIRERDAARDARIRAELVTKIIGEFDALPCSTIHTNDAGRLVADVAERMKAGAK